MTRIEGFVVLTAASLLFLAILGSWRRKNRNLFIQTAVLAAYTSSSSLISYTLGSMQSSTVKSSMYPIWAVSLYLLLGSADSITAYSLMDHHQQPNRLMFRFLLDVSFVLLIALTTSPRLQVICFLCAIASLKVCHRAGASLLALSSWNLNKMVADYMDRREQNKSGSYDPVSMEGYRYLVDWPLRDSKLEADTSYATELTKAADIIDIQRVFLSKDQSLIPELKDACLSFSLSHLLRRRLYGFVCGESMEQQTHDFVFKGLLSCENDEASAINHERVFGVIEVELAFIYDFFFTKHGILYYGSWAATFWSLASASLMFVAAYLTAITETRILTSSGEDVSFLFSTSTLMIDSTITLAILASIMLLEVLHQLFFWTSIWGRVSFVCQRLREETSNNWCMKFICIKFKEILARIGVRVWRGSSYWQDKLGQYSLLESVDTTPSPSNLLIYISQCAVTYLSFLYVLDYAALHQVRDHHQLSVRRPGKPVDLTAQVKEALAKFLARSNGILTNGKSLLNSNGADHLSWACDHPGWGTSCSRKENQVYCILTWHIATCYCEMGALKHFCLSVGEQLKVHHDVATKLSRYCAYLVVCAPKLLPGNSYNTARVFDAVAAEAIRSLGGQKDKYEAMRSLPIISGAAPGSKAKVFEAGVRLGRQLEQMEVGACWTVLANFWTEMILYVAPSGNTKEHIEFLAKGGELVTHLWALLFHAGIVKQQQEDHVASVWP